MAGVHQYSGHVDQGEAEMIVLPSPPDDRDILYVAQPGPWAAAVDLKPDVFEVDDQGQVVSCNRLHRRLRI